VLALAAGVAALVAVSGALLTYALVARPQLRAEESAARALELAKGRIAELEAELSRCAGESR
jgi:hypothetical protein